MNFGRCGVKAMQRPYTPLEFSIKRDNDPLPFFIQGY